MTDLDQQTAARQLAANGFHNYLARRADIAAGVSRHLAASGHDRADPATLSDGVSDAVFRLLPVADTDPPADEFAYLQSDVARWLGAALVREFGPLAENRRVFAAALYDVVAEVLGAD